MNIAITTTIPNIQIAIRKGDFKASLKLRMPYFTTRHILSAVPAVQSTITAMASVIIKGVKRNLKILASWGACSSFINILYHDDIKNATLNDIRNVACV